MRTEHNKTSTSLTTKSTSAPAGATGNQRNQSRTQSLQRNWMMRMQARLIKIQPHSQLLSMQINSYNVVLLKLECQASVYFQYHSRRGNIWKKNLDAESGHVCPIPAELRFKFSSYNHQGVNAKWSHKLAERIPKQTRSDGKNNGLRTLWYTNKTKAHRYPVSFSCITKLERRG